MHPGQGQTKAVAGEEGGQVRADPYLPPGAPISSLPGTKTQLKPIVMVGEEGEIAWVICSRERANHRLSKGQPSDSGFWHLCPLLKYSLPRGESFPSMATRTGGVCVPTCDMAKAGEICLGGAQNHVKDQAASVRTRTYVARARKIYLE